MNQAELFAKYRAASRRATWGALLLVTGIVVVIGWQVRELSRVESDIQAQEDRLEDLKIQKASLTEELRKLTVDPTGGVRASAKRLNTDSVRYDFSIWIDTSNLPDPVREVRYVFPDSPYDPAASQIDSNGFAVYFRGVDCPKQAQVTIVFENTETQSMDYDFCDKMINIKR